MPWQQQVVDVATEYDPVTGIPAYREAIVTVPRQSGKTTIELDVMLDRALMWGGPKRIAYTAQTGQDARAKVINDWWPVLRRSPFKSAITRMLRGAAETAMDFRSGSRLEVLATAEEAGHGRILDLGFIDEAFADTDERREQALLPAMATRADAQLWILSTMGTGDSVYLNRKVAAGRLAAETGQTSGLCYFEWSALPGSDPDDPATWWNCMPALGHTITEDVIRHARTTMPDGEFLRAMMNLRHDSDTRWIAPEAWAAVKHKSMSAPPKGTTIAAAFDGSYNQDATAIAGCTLDGHVFKISLWERPASAGPEWVVPRGEVDRKVAEMMAEYKVVRFMCDRSRWYDYTERWWETYGDVVIDAGPDRRRAIDACALFYSAVMGKRLTHDGSPDLTRHLANAVVKETVDGAYITKAGRHSPHKIDLAWAAVTAHQAALTVSTVMAEPWSVYA